MKEGFKPLDLATLLSDDEAIEFFLSDAFTEDDPAYIIDALGVAVRAKGMIETENDAGTVREALYRSFSEEGDPSLKSTIAVLKSLGLVLGVRPVSSIETYEETQAAE